MTEQTRSASTDLNSVRKVVVVQAPPVVAWRVFTERMGTWWPLANWQGKGGGRGHRAPCRRPLV
jgi:hypothetical protein